MEWIKGYFTIERNIIGLTTREIEYKLGFRPGRLTHGGRVLALARAPLKDQFMPAGSSLFPDAKGLNAKVLERTAFIPGAWMAQRLVKVEPRLPHTEFEWYPPAGPTAAEQWILKHHVQAYEVAQLAAGKEYWP